MAEYVHAGDQPFESFIREVTIHSGVTADVDAVDSRDLHMVARGPKTGSFTTEAEFSTGQRLSIFGDEYEVMGLVGTLPNRLNVYGITETVESLNRVNRNGD